MKQVFVDTSADTLLVSAVFDAEWTWYMVVLNTAQVFIA